MDGRSRDERAAFDLWLNRSLRTLYNPVLNEQIPSALTALLREQPGSD